MKTLENSRRCLAHPVSLLSIGLLILNDHLFKAISPSWLTGKLSDFAGLFFFPFLLAICFGIAFRRASPKTIGALAIGVTAIWFTLIKMTALGNALTEEMLARLLGVPVQIVLDPTDLIALPVLIPAWRLWNRAESPRSTRLSWIALGVASLAVMASSCPPNARVDRIFHADGILYAHYSTFYNRDLTTWWSNDSYLFSKDNGRSWNNICDYKTQKCQDIPSAVKSPTKLPIVECSREDPKKCYRIAAQGQVEESDDNGQNWQIAWQIPSGRRYFMQRLGDYSRCWRAVDLGPYDLIVPESGEDTVLVAMGTEGLLVRTREGNWQQVSFWMQDLLPLSARNLDEALKAIAREVDFTVLFALLVLWLLPFRSAQILKNILPEKQPSAFRRASPSFIIFVLAGVTICVWYISGFLALGSPILFTIQILRDWRVTGVFILIPVIGVVSLLIAFISTWSLITRSVAFPNRVWLIAGRTVLVALLIASLVIGIFLLWTFGAIAEYALAAFLALIVSIALLVYGYRGVEAWTRECG